MTSLVEPPVADAGDGRFRVRLTNFEGPFDLLLQLIGKHQLDVTEIALSRVTDDFIAHLHALGDELDLDQASEFLVVAATLLDLKAARLLPAADVEDEEDLAVLEARDLLFARLLQYRPTSRSSASCASGRPRPPVASRGRPPWSRGSPRCCPRCCSASPPSSSPTWPRRRSPRSRRRPSTSRTCTPRR